MRSAFITLGLACVLFTPLLAQSVLLDVAGAAPFNLFGADVAAGDVDNDGRDDMIVGSPGFNGPNGSNSGRVVVYSGLTGGVLYTLDGLAAGDLFGTSVAAADYDDDGHDDVVVGAPGVSTLASMGGRAFVISGADGTTLLDAVAVVAAGAQTGFSVANAGDVNNDGTDEVIVGAPFTNSDAGLVAVLGLNANFGSISGAAGDRLGYSVAGVGDVDGDSRDDVIIGSPSSGPSPLGKAEVYSLVPTISVLRTATSMDEGFGLAVSGAGNVNGDATPDFAVGAPGFGAGSVYVFSGTNASQLRRYDGVGFGDDFGTSVTSMGDVDGDGVDDLAAGSLGAPPLPQPGAQRGRGYVQVFSGSDGARIIKIDGETTGDSFGTAVAAGDLNGDGTPDLVVGADSDPAPSVLTGRAAAFDLKGHYPGSFEDLALSTGINVPASRVADVKTASGGDGLVVHLGSPSGAYDGTIPILLVQAFGTGSPPSPLPMFPEFALDPNAVGVLFDGSSHPIFGLSLLPAGGLTFLYPLPAGFAGTSALLQGFSLSPSARQSNPFFTATNAHEIQLM